MIYLFKVEPKLREVSNNETVWYRNYMVLQIYLTSISRFGKSEQVAFINLPIFLTILWSQIIFFIFVELILTWAVILAIMSLIILINALT
jgi:hypothetical protein